MLHRALVFHLTNSSRREAEKNIREKAEAKMHDRGKNLVEIRKQH